MDSKYACACLAGSQRQPCLCARGDGRLSIYDWRNKRQKVRPRFGSEPHLYLTICAALQVTEQLEDEIMSVVVMKDGQLVVCGTQDGALIAVKVRTALPGRAGVLDVDVCLGDRCSTIVGRLGEPGRSLARPSQKRRYHGHS